MRRTSTARNRLWARLGTSQALLVLSETAFAGSVVSGQSGITLGVIGITNGGTLPLAGPTFSIAYGGTPGWLTVAPVDPPGGPVVEWSVVVDATALGASTQAATVTVLDTNASNSGITFGVTATITALVPTLAVSPTALTFSVVDEQAGTAQTVTISNVGSGTLATPTVGTITGAGAARIASAVITGSGPTYTLTVTPTGVGGTVGGPYPLSIPVISSGASNTPLAVTADVTVTSAQTAVLSLVRTLDDFRYTVGGSNPAALTIGILNVGSGTLQGPTILSSGYSGAHTGWATPTINGVTLTMTINASAITTPGISFFGVTIQDANSATTITYTALLNVNAQASPVMVVSPASVNIPVPSGTSPPPVTLAITNAGGGSLGTISSAFVGAPPAWVTVSQSATPELTFSTSGLANGTYTTTVRVSASLAVNSPVDVPVQVVVSTVSATYPVPTLAQRTAGYTWDAALGYPVGSCFNDGVNGYTGSPNGERPTFSGATFNVPATPWTTIYTQLGNGTIGSGDIIKIAAGTVITEPQLPARPGWTAAVANPFVLIQSDSMASLPAYSYASGPASYDEPHRGGKNSHLPFMPTMRSVTTNRSALLPQGNASGYWFEGIDFRASIPQNPPSLSSQSHQGIVLIQPHSGTAVGPRNTLALLPSHYVFDRCRFRSDDLCKNGIELNGRYIRVTHSTIDFIRQGPVSGSNNHESHAFVTYNSDGHFDILGNQYSAWGISFLIGGAIPSIPNVLPSDGMDLWNVIHNDDTIGTQLDSDDCKNAIEHKTGQRWTHAFNSIQFQWYHDQQRQTLFTKAVDPQSSGLYAAYTTDILYWCNRITNSGKGFFQASDLLASTGSNTGAGIGSERIECKYNLHQWDSSRIPPRYPLGANQIYALFVTKSNGNGIPGCEVSNNTFGTKHSFMEMDTAAPGAAWTGVKFENNVHTDTPAFGPIRGNTGTNSALLDQAYGAGNWTFRRNVTGPGGALWDATLLNANNANGYLLAGGLAANFVNAAAGDFTLVPGHPKKGTGFDGKDPGYDHAYMTAMLTGIVPNTS